MQLKRHLVGLACCAIVAEAAHLVATSTTAVADDKWRLALDTLIYSDTDNVVVVTPQTSVRYLLDDEGGEVRARVGVDVVSAASVDLVAQATSRFTEARTEVNLGIAKAFGDWLPSFDYRLSYEPDYFSNGGRVAVRRRLGSPDTVLQVGYGFTWDVVGRADTPWVNYAQTLGTHRADVSITQTLGPSTLVRGVFTLTVNEGYQAKPYRYVPLFDQASVQRASDAGVRLDLSSFSAYSMSARAREEEPYQRVGAAMAGRVMHWIPEIRGSLRLDYQLYFDDWGLVGNTLEPALAIGALREFLFTVYLRLYFQGAVTFWRRQYVVDAGTYPTYRTLDRELSDFRTVTAGFRAEWRTPDERLGLFADGSVAYSHFDDFLFLDDRIAMVVQAGARWTP